MTFKKFHGFRFGLVTLASSGTEGGPNIGAMRLAQTAGHGVLPNADMPNSFLAQAGDLQDPWGPAVGPCFHYGATDWNCCGVGQYTANRTSATCHAGTGSLGLGLTFGRFFMFGKKMSPVLLGVTPPPRTPPPRTPCASMLVLVAVVMAC